MFSIQKSPNRPLDRVSIVLLGKEGVFKDLYSEGYRLDIQAKYTGQTGQICWFSLCFHELDSISVYIGLYPSTIDSTTLNTTQKEEHHQVKVIRDVQKQLFSFTAEQDTAISKGVAE